ncbi:hypothetical protein [Aeromicrobium sp.]|uniref:hypothetical protein n=1 Tax=Aeromicrobium sp. TaxID=1871063 RepID=UPI0030C3E37F
MITEYLAQADTQQRERELVETLERRRVAAERAVEHFGGNRLALIAHLARTARASGGVNAHPVSC